MNFFEVGEGQPSTNSQLHMEAQRIKNREEGYRESRMKAAIFKGISLEMEDIYRLLSMEQKLINVIARADKFLNECGRVK